MTWRTNITANITTLSCVDAAAFGLVSMHANKSRHREGLPGT